MVDDIMVFYGKLCRLVLSSEKFVDKRKMINKQGTGTFAAVV